MTRRGPAATFLTGALFVLSYALGTPGYDVPGLPLVCLAPFLALASSARSVRHAAWRGWIAGTAASIPLYYWIAYTVGVQGKLGWVLGGVAAFLVSAYVGAYFSVAAAAARRLEGRFGEGGLWLFPAAWTAVEMARSYLFTGFPWMLLGYSVAGSATLRQAADLAGIHGLSFLLALSGVSVYLAGRRLSGRLPWKAAFPLIPGVAALLFLVLYGRILPANPAGPADRIPEVKVAIAQGGIDQAVKWDPENQVATLEIYRELTRQARDAGATVVVWPETAAPFIYGWEAELSRRLEAIAVSGGVPILFGAPWFDPAEGGKFYNSVFQMDARGVVLGRYDKRHLVPFGEYIPLRPILFFLNKLTEGAEDFSTGTGPALFRHDRPAGGRVGMLRGALSGVDPGWGPRRRDVARERDERRLVRRHGRPAPAPRHGADAERGVPAPHGARRQRGDQRGHRRGRGRRRLPRPLPPGNRGRLGPAGDRRNRLRKNRGNLWDFL